MALREIRIQGDPVLEKKCRPVKEITPRIRELIAMGASTGEMRDAAEAEGMRSLRQSARRLVLEGQTTIKEMMRISVDSLTED